MWGWKGRNTEGSHRGGMGGGGGGQRLRVGRDSVVCVGGGGG